jgi:Fic family protein
MKSFEHGVLERQPLTMELLRTARLLGEYKGKQELYRQQSPEVLETLRQVAIIQSTESSNRIEGVVVPADRLKALMAQKTTPRNRSESEVAGYRDVLSTVHASHEHIPLTPNVVLQLHRDLFQFVPQEGGRWKVTENQIVERHPDGTVIVRFQPVPPWQTPMFMEELCQRFNERWQQGDVEPLLLVPTLVLDFLCVHPFSDGNGRMARLLTVLLLYQAGYEVVRFISLERIIEQTRETYYDALEASSRGWHEAQHDLTPWWNYFLGVLLAAYREFEERVGLLTTTRGAKSEMVRLAIERLPQPFSISDLERVCPSVSRPLIRKVLNELKGKHIRPVGRGAGAKWERM